MKRIGHQGTQLGYRVRHRRHIGLRKRGALDVDEVAALEVSSHRGRQQVLDRFETLGIERLEMPAVVSSIEHRRNGDALYPDRSSNGVGFANRWLIVDDTLHR